MNSKGTSKKHQEIEKTNAVMFAVIALASAVLSFTIVSSISLSRRLSYQSRVINARVDAEKQLKSNLAAVESLLVAYENFDSASESVLGTRDKNSKIILDALPSKYDFPALTASLEKVFNITGGLSSLNITGSDQEATAEQSSINPSPIEIPIRVSGKGSYESIQKLITNMQNSIRPFKVNSISLSGEQRDMNFDIAITTYYMPEKNLEITLEEIN